MGKAPRSRPNGGRSKLVTATAQPKPCAGMSLELRRHVQRWKYRLFRGSLGSLITGAIAFGRLSLARPVLRLEPPRQMRRSAPPTRIALAWVRVIWTDEA